MQYKNYCSEKNNHCGNIAEPLKSPANNIFPSLQNVGIH